MAETTGISWTGATWNPWQGCTKVSPGCKNCYAETLFRRWGKDFSQLRRSAPTTFNAPLRWKEPKLIFTCSMSDFFHRQADPWRDEAWDIIQRTPQHTYQILTKRPGLMVDWAKKHGWPDHVWAGVSVESQKYAPRLDVLARVPAKVRFVSCEPLLAPLNLQEYLYAGPWLEHDQPGVHWVIAGGESGSNYRPMALLWLEDLVGQCDEARIPVFIKQDSAPRPGMQGRIPASLWARKELP